VVLPGVGAFGDAMHELQSRNLVEPIQEIIQSGKPFLGVCLGLQLLFEIGHEGGRHKGLGVFAGEVKRFDLPPEYKVPHMGWNSVTIRNKSPILASMADGTHFYFVHSYVVAPTDAGIVALESEYGGPFPAMVWRDNVYATQFHPEKSQTDGLQLLKNFAELA